MEPKVGHKTHFRESEGDRGTREDWELDSRGGGRGRGIWQIGLLYSAGIIFGHPKVILGSSGVILK